MTQLWVHWSLHGLYFDAEVHFLRRLQIFVALFVVGLNCLGQNEPYAEDLSSLAAAGKVENKTYSNTHAGFLLHLPQTPCDAKLNTALDPRQGTAMLLDCQHVVQGWGGMYALNIFVETWARFPTLQSTEQYVRSMRHIGERDPNIKILETETKRTMAGLDFWQIILSNHLSGSRIYFEGLSCTRLKAYVLCFKAEAPTVDLVRALLNLNGKLEIQSAQPVRKPGLK